MSNIPFNASHKVRLYRYYIGDMYQAKFDEEDCPVDFIYSGNYKWRGFESVFIQRIDGLIKENEKKTGHVRYDRYADECTGIYDSKGNLIYENDFLKDNDGKIYFITWSKRGCWRYFELIPNLVLCGNYYKNGDLVWDFYKQEGGP